MTNKNVKGMYICPTLFNQYVPNAGQDFGCQYISVFVYTGYCALCLKKNCLVDKHDVPLIPQVCKTTGSLCPRWLEMNGFSVEAMEPHVLTGHTI